MCIAVCLAASARVSKSFSMMQMRLRMLQRDSSSSGLIAEAKQEGISAHVDAAGGLCISGMRGSHPLGW